VAKRFANGTAALVGLDVSVNAGEFLSLVGPSGCGKSTALRLIAGLTPPSDGRVRWDGRDQPPPAGEIGFVFQEATLMPWAPALANVTLPLKLARLPRRESQDRARDALALVGLAGFERAYPRELSGGMRMRVSIARALVMRPRLLLMDEPFAALDEITRLKLNDDLLALWAERGLTIVFVTHSVYESAYLSSRVAIMAARPGRIVEDRPLPAAYPRDAGFRHSAEYGTACTEISAALARAMAT
jgi:NitT/TauT family transport system ATP-binding protein